MDLHLFSFLSCFIIQLFGQTSDGFIVKRMTYNGNGNLNLSTILSGKYFMREKTGEDPQTSVTTVVGDGVIETSDIGEETEVEVGTMEGNIVSTDEGESTTKKDRDHLGVITDPRREQQEMNSASESTKMPTTNDGSLDIPSNNQPSIDTGSPTRMILGVASDRTQSTADTSTSVTPLTSKHPSENNVSSTITVDSTATGTVASEPTTQDRDNNKSSHGTTDHQPSTTTGTLEHSTESSDSHNVTTSDHSTDVTGSTVTLNASHGPGGATHTSQPPSNLSEAPHQSSQPTEHPNASAVPSEATPSRLSSTTSDPQIHVLPHITTTTIAPSATHHTGHSSQSTTTSTKNPTTSSTTTTSTTRTSRLPTTTPETTTPPTTTPSTTAATTTVMVTTVEYLEDPQEQGGTDVTGLIIYICVGVFLGAAIVLILVFVYVMVCKKKKKGSADPAQVEEKVEKNKFSKLFSKDKRGTKPTAKRRLGPSGKTGGLPPMLVDSDPAFLNEFKYKGRLVMKDQVPHGRVRHALENDVSKSLSRIVFDNRDNEIYHIGTDVEIVEAGSTNSLVIDGDLSLRTALSGTNNPAVTSNRASLKATQSHTKIERSPNSSRTGPTGPTKSLTNVRHRKSTKH